MYSLSAPSAQKPQNSPFASTCTQLTLCALLASNRATQLHNACTMRHASVAAASDELDAAKWSPPSLVWGGASSTTKIPSHTGTMSTNRFRQVAKSFRTQPLHASGDTVSFQMSFCAEQNHTQTAAHTTRDKPAPSCTPAKTLRLLPSVKLPRDSIHTTRQQRSKPHSTRHRRISRDSTNRRQFETTWVC